MKNSIILLLVLTTSIVFASCKTLPQENSSATESTTSTFASIYSELESIEETLSSNESSSQLMSSATQEPVPTTPSSNNSSETLPPSNSSKCTHPDYWEGYGEGLHFITGWHDRKPGIENKFELLAECEEPRQVIYKCPICLEPVLLETLEPLGHDFSGEEEILFYPSVNSEGSWGIRCKSLLGCFETKVTNSIPKRGGNYETIDSCFTVSISSYNNLESYKTENNTISISDYRTWGSVPTIEFDTETYTGSISYVLQDGSLYKRNIFVDKTKMTEGVHYLGKILESGEYEGRYWALTSNGTSPS